MGDGIENKGSASGRIRPSTRQKNGTGSSVRGLCTIVVQVIGSREP